jgi:exodeoxyribonuclease V gamma subunit
VVLRDGALLAGTVPGVCGDTLRTVTYARVNPRARLVAWIRLLALSAAHPERAWSAVTVGRAASGARDDAAVTIARIPLLADDPPSRREIALDHLDVLLDLYARGMREPPPLACRSSAAYAAAARAGGDPIDAARREWLSSFDFDREDREAEHQLVLGAVRTLDELLDEPARGDEVGPWWDPDERTRFGRWARRLWDGLLQWEELSHR